jgi:hypothetical protein
VDDYTQTDEYVELQEAVLSEDVTQEQRDRWNAVAWLAMSDAELVNCSASLGMPGGLNADPGEPSGQLPTYAQVEQLRAAADDVAREHAGDEFVDAWIADNRSTDPDDIVVP